MSTEFDTDDEETPVGKDWKEYWRSKEKDPNHKRETRQDKKAARRQIHKKSRRKVKDKLRNWEHEAES